MAIGISYTGHDGRRMDFAADGNPEPGSELDRIVRGADAGAGEVRRVMTPLADAMRRARRPQGPDPRIDKAAGTVKLDLADHRPGTLADKVDVGGSIEASQSGMRLKGDGEPRLDGLYAKKGGRRGFFSLDEIDDPNAKGGIVGEQDAANRFAASNKESGGNGAFSENMQSRTEAEVNEETGEVTFWEYTKRWDVTNGRRVGGVSGETKRKICSFFLEAGGDRQITLTRERAPFTVVRSHYKDENGETQYEYWVKCLKWGVHQNGSDYSASGIRNEGANYHGAYAFGSYGHYPQRPSDRPRKIELDSGREALVDLFEERSTSPTYNDNCNCWTYIGSSKEFPDGNFKLYGYFFEYDVPYKNNVININEASIKISCPDLGAAYGSYIDPAVTLKTPTPEYSFKKFRGMVVTAKQYDKRELLGYLVSQGGLVASAHTNDGFNESFETAEYYHDGAMVFKTAAPAFENILSEFDIWGGAANIRAGYPYQSEGLMRRISEVVADYSGHDFRTFVNFYYQDVWVSFNVTPTSTYQGQTGQQVYESYGRPARVSGWFAEEESLIENTDWKFTRYRELDYSRIAELEQAIAENDAEYHRLIDEYDTYVAEGREEEWQALYDANYEEYQRLQEEYNATTKETSEEAYNGNWQDFFPFASAAGNYTGSCIAEIKDWEIVENNPAYRNTYFAITEDLKGEILRIAQKYFGDTVEKDGEEIIIKDDVVIVEKKKQAA